MHQSMLMSLVFEIAISEWSNQGDDLSITEAPTSDYNVF